MTRERKLLWVSVGFAVAGWLSVGALTIDRDTLKQQVVSIEQEAATWKHQAGKAYTELLEVRGGTDSQTAAIPVGARYECQIKEGNDDGHTVAQCKDGIIYPPQEY